MRCLESVIINALLRQQVETAKCVLVPVSKFSVCQGPARSSSLRWVVQLHNRDGFFGCYLRLCFDLRLLFMVKWIGNSHGCNDGYIERALDPAIVELRGGIFTRQLQLSNKIESLCCLKSRMSFKFIVAAILTFNNVVILVKCRPRM